jgi:hypothetical protein
MILRELLSLLNKIKKAHPEAAEADVWGIPPDLEAGPFPISYVGYDKKHKPARIKLEE